MENRGRGSGMEGGSRQCRIQGQGMGGERVMETRGGGGGGGGSNGE